jgi:hypothetical protein
VYSWLSVVFIILGVSVADQDPDLDTDWVLIEGGSEDSQPVVSKSGF